MGENEMDMERAMKVDQLAMLAATLQPADWSERAMENALSAAEQLLRLAEKRVK